VEVCDSCLSLEDLAMVPSSSIFLASSSFTRYSCTVHLLDFYNTSMSFLRSPSPVFTNDFSRYSLTSRSRTAVFYDNFSFMISIYFYCSLSLSYFSSFFDLIRNSSSSPLSFYSLSSLRSSSMSF
jgi:hypothetical protein